MEIGLKSAIIISAILHACIAAPFYGHNLIKADFERRNAVIVDYVILKELSNITPANVGGRESVDVAQAPNAEVKSKPADNKISVKEKDKTDEKVPAKRTISDDTDKKETELKSNKDYINYYGFLKDRIRSRLQENYKFYKGEGDVYLSFVLNAKGALISYGIDRSRSAQDEVLLHITRTSLIAVAPFPALPKTISAPQMAFNITISFKKQ